MVDLYLIEFAKNSDRLTTAAAAAEFAKPAIVLAMVIVLRWRAQT